MDNIWKTDHANFNPSEDSDLSFVYVNQRIEEYLKLKTTNNKYFLVGRKGVGKSLLLIYKSYLFRNKIYKDKGFKFLPQNQLVESLNVDYDTFSKEHLLKFQDSSLWKSIWKFTILYAICRANNTELDEKLVNMVDMNRIASILGLLLQHRGDVNKFTKWNTYLNDKVSTIQNGVAVFIDNLDQIFEDELKSYHYTDSAYKSPENPSIKFWINVQNGLMIAIYEINQFNSHIKIFTTIRQEAFNNYQGALIANLRDYSTELSYSKEEVKQIFLNRLKEIEGFRDIAKKSLIQTFFGFSEMKHPFAMDEKKKKKIEKVFDFLFRHTFGRPREILTIGKNISILMKEPDFLQKNPIERKRAIRLCVNDTSNGIIFSDYKKEIIPSFNSLDFKNFVKLINKNIIPKSEISSHNLDLVKFYFNLGLIGYIKEEVHTENKFIQSFLPSSKYNYNDLIDLPDSNYYFFHPSIDKALIDNGGGGFTFFYDNFNIIGNGYVFKEPSMDDIILNRTIQYFLPKVPGARWTTPSPAARQHLPLSEYYDHLYSSLASNIKNLRNDYYYQSEYALNIIGRITACILLEEYSKKYIKKKEKLLNELLVDTIIRERVPKLDSNLNYVNMKAFGKRLYARLITMGCYLYLDYTCNQIHSLFIEGKVDLIPKVYNEQENQRAYKYIQHRFFIGNMLNDGQAKANRDKSKKDIFNAASQFEQHRLEIWYSRFINDIVLENWIDKGHIPFLKIRLSAVNAFNKNNNTL